MWVHIWSTGEIMTNLLQNPFSSTAFYYGRPAAPSRTYTGDSFAGTGFGNNIWQTDSRNDLVTRDYVRQNSEGGRKDLSVSD